MSTSPLAEEAQDQLYSNVKDVSEGAFPWSGDQRGADKTRIFKYLLNSPDGVPISLLVQHVFGVHSAGDDRPYQREYRFVKRFVESCPLFEIDGRKDILHVAPRPAAFHLTSSKHYSNTDAVGRSSDNGDKTGKTEENVIQLPGETSIYEFPRDYARNFISSRGFDEITESRAAVIEGQFARYLEQIDDRWNILKNIRGELPEYLLVPYRTLYNSPERADDNWQRYHSAWENATREYRVGVQLTLTTDPERYESIQEMADESSKNFNRFMSWVRRKLADRCSDLGTKGHRIEKCSECEEYAERPPYVKVLEWTEKGRPHFHIILFGIDWLAPQHEIADYWGKYQADVVDVRKVSRVKVGGDRSGIEVSGDRYRWLSKSKDENGDIETKNEKAHLGKYLTKQMPANESVKETKEKVGAGENLWKTALFWATGKQFWTCSRDLKGDEGEDELFDLPQYVWVGAAKSGDIPGFVLEQAAMVRDRPPP